MDKSKSILIEEFGKDYGAYFSILSATARGKTSRSEIELIVGRKIGGYFTKLEKEYEVISNNQPIFEKSSAKNVRYTIEIISSVFGSVLSTSTIICLRLKTMMQ